MTILVKVVKCFGRDTVLACDGRCDKAWGHNGNRPRIGFDPNDPDDYAYLADTEFFEEAPIDPGTYEGEHGKPQAPEERLNKWCLRECERSARAPLGEIATLPDFSKRRYNQPWKHPEALDV